MTEETKTDTVEETTTGEEEAVKPDEGVESSTTTEGETEKETSAAEKSVTQDSPAKKDREKRRLNAAKRKAREAESNAKYWQGKAEGLAEGRAEAKTTVAKTDDDPRPKSDNYEDNDDYIADVAAWSARQEVKKHKTATVVEPPAKEPPKPTTAYEKKVDEFLQGAAKKATETGEFRSQKEFFSHAAELKIPERIMEDLVDLDNGADVLTHLVDDPEELERIAELTPRAQTKEIENLGSRLQKVAVSGAPPPVSTVKTSKEPVEKHPDDIPIEEWMKRENAKDWKQRFG